MNIIELIENQIDDRFTHATTSETGLGPDETRATTRAAIPALLAGLLSAISKPGGTKALGAVLKDPNLRGDLSSMAGGAGTQAVPATGIGALTSLLGEGRLSSLVNAIGGFGGISQGQSRSLIGMLFPLVLGVLGREQRGGTASADGIAQLLKGQKREIADAMPAGVASSLRSTGMLDALDEEPVPRRPAASAAAMSAASARNPRHDDTRPPAKKNRSWFWPVAAGVAAIAIAVWGLGQFRDAEPERQIATEDSGDTSELVAVAPSDIDLRVGDVDLGQELTGIVDRAAQSLSGITDAASAEAALPTLTKVNDNLDDMIPMVDRLPDPARAAFADRARSGYSRLESEIDRIESLPAIPDSVRQVVGELSGKLESFFVRGRG